MSQTLQSNVWNNAIFRGRRSWKALVAFFSSLVVLTAILSALGPYRITMYEHDTMRFLVEADFMLKGHRPYVDYWTTHGVFPFFFPLVGLYSCGVSLWAVLVGQLLGAWTFGVLLFRVTFNRLGAYWAVGLGVTAFLLLTTFTPPGHRVWQDFSCAMWYNTMGFILEAIVFLYVFLPAEGTRSGRVVDGAIVAFCLAALFFVKLSFILPTLATFVVGTMLWPREKERRWEGLAVLVAAGCFLIGISLVSSASAKNYLAFLLSIPPKVNPILLVLRYVQFTRTISGVFVATLFLGWAAARAGLFRPMLREWLLIVMTTATFMLTATTACQDQEAIPLLGLMPVVAASTLLRLTSSESQLATVKYPALAAIILGGVMLVHAPKDAALSWVFSRVSVRTLGSHAGTANVLSGEERASLRMLEGFPRSYRDRIAEGTGLLEQAGSKAGEVFFLAAAVDDVTIFTPLRYAKGSSPWWQIGFSTSPETFPLSQPDLLSDVQWILQERSDMEFWKFLTHHRGDYLNAHFLPVAESPLWVLWKRTDDG